MFTLYRDGKQVLQGTEKDLWNYLHRTHSFSIYHALRWEGYSIRKPDGSAYCYA
jgi:hypothetical protein